MIGLIGISSSTFAVAIVAVLFALFVLLLLGSFARSRKAAASLEAAGERGPGAGRPGEPAAAPAAAPAPKVRNVVSRRDFFRGGLLASLGVFLAQFGGASLAFLWPNLKGGFGSVITAGAASDIKAFIQQNKQPFYYGAGRFYVVDYPVSPVPSVYAGIVSEGLMALYQRCVHLGCRVPFCQQSQWFECPCHGSKYNHAGEYQLGPAPHGMDRFVVTITGGNVSVDTSNIIIGPPRGTNTIHQAPEGPFCV